jgi:general secretion pathway protein A
MYLNYFGLAEAPFSIAPDPRYLYMSSRHQEALAHLLYGVHGGGGFVLLTGEVGTGKTTVCRCLLEQIPDSCEVAYIFNPKLTVAELLSTICTEFGIAFPENNDSVMVYVNCINRFLLDAHARGKHLVLIIDEAQNLEADVLEQLRLLTNLETNERKLLQIILLGQPELVDMLARPELRQLAQRIIARYHLGPLSLPEVTEYVRHRLEVSGTHHQLIPTRLMALLYRLSGGIPRLINVLCDRALLGAYVQSKEKVDRKILKQAALEVLQKPVTKHNLLHLTLLSGLLILFAAVVYQSVRPPPALPPVPQKVAQKLIVHKPSEPLPGTLIWLTTEPRENSLLRANEGLFSLWGMTFMGKDACTQAETVGLRCQTARGGLTELRQMNRPAVLLMHDSEDFYATLSRLDEKSATFRIGNLTREVALGALAEQWSGQYTLLWRPPPITSKKIRPGERGPDVIWLRKTLAQIYGKATPYTEEQVYDDEMVLQVKQFKLLQGLTPSGIVSPEALIRLSDVADLTAPKLSHQKGAQ